MIHRFDYMVMPGGLADSIENAIAGGRLMDADSELAIEAGLLAHALLSDPLVRMGLLTAPRAKSLMRLAEDMTEGPYHHSDN
jgi:hypothetical protein